MQESINELYNILLGCGFFFLSHSHCFSHTHTQAHAHTLRIARDPRCRMDVKGFVFCQQHSSTSHDYSVDSHREDRAKKVEDERRKKKRVGCKKRKGCVGDWE